MTKQKGLFRVEEILNNKLAIFLAVLAVVFGITLILELFGPSNLKVSSLFYQVAPEVTGENNLPIRYPVNPNVKQNPQMPNVDFKY